MITWFHRVERDGQRAASSKVQRVIHFPAGTTIGVIEFELFKEAGKGSMADGELNNLPGPGSCNSSPASERFLLAILSIKREIWSNDTSEYTNMGKDYLPSIMTTDNGISIANVQLSSPIQYTTTLHSRCC
ncbi:hypothetical protein AVEN_77059-1 [Araneus ventricosus]|uniref:Uncharacterized protein n=1 Tax=Araneus ventricosus TaxID=182803 RepID=A0A4Y2G8L5_ARAVE|nr:hypothetical protein AVEN_77059-1 [Araneus ventricosus]